MFKFIDMIGNYESRVVARTDINYGFGISTAEVNDGEKPYETAIAHPEYNSGKLIIVEAYDTRDEAQAGHIKWKNVMTADLLPNELVDCCNSELQRFVGPAKYQRILRN